MTTATLSFSRHRTSILPSFLFASTFRVGVCVVLIVCAFFYIFKMSAVSTKGFEIATLERQITTLERDIQKVDVEIAEYRSMESIQARVVDLNLVEAGPTTYLTPVGTAVARR